MNPISPKPPLQTAIEAVQRAGRLLQEAAQATDAGIVRRLAIKAEAAAEAAAEAHKHAWRLAVAARQARDDHNHDARPAASRPTDPDAYEYVDTAGIDYALTAMKDLQQAAEAIAGAARALQYMTEVQQPRITAVPVYFAQITGRPARKTPSPQD